MKIRNPYRNHPQWFRGNTHTHSTLSDGEWPLEQVVAYYRDRGYAFLAMTDHDVFTDLAPFSTPDFVGLAADEVTVRGRDHIVGLRLHGVVEPFSNDHQRTLDAIAAQGGLAILAHPNWSWLTVEQCLAWQGYQAIEILNGVCNYLEYNGYALSWWDQLLRRGVRVWGVAADDAHRIPYQGAKAWIMVNAEALTAEGIVCNIRSGNFYASTGPTFQRFEVDAGTIKAWCSPAVEVRFMTGAVNPALRLRGDALTEAEYTPRPGEAYVRIEVVDAQMQTAWSQPFFLDPDWRP
ncbi:MAG: CehA/McbA family metallohydrolase [candidate division NC10 bacterium]|nr:CehA/McbA family metallohydrolase [candidate division NC10 bacterium]